MTAPVLIDTGPLVAFLNRRDRYHMWASDQLAGMTPPLLTCEAVISETSFLLRLLPSGPIAVLELINRGLLQMPFRLGDEIVRIKGLMMRYANVPMSLADACLVRMAEQYPGSRLFTCDSDFTIYRKNRRQVIPTLMPDG
jgi:predicted nucleic acid-binding protein